MNAMSFKNPLLLAALVLGAAFAPGPARADGGASEEFYLPRADIHDDALRGVIGIVTLGRGPETPRELSLYEPDGRGFRPRGAVPLEKTRAISGFDFEGALVRRYPVVDKRGEYLLAVLDVQTNGRAWIHENEWAGPEDFVVYHGMEDGEAFVGSAVDLLALNPAEKVELFPSPRPGAHRRPAAVEPPLDALRVMRVDGDFAQVGLFRGLDEELEPVGWVRIRDAQGLLIAWPVASDDC